MTFDSKTNFFFVVTISDEKPNQDQPEVFDTGSSEEDTGAGLFGDGSEDDDPDLREAMRLSMLDAGEQQPEPSKPVEKSPEPSPAKPEQPAAAPAVVVPVLSVEEPKPKIEPGVVPQPPKPAVTPVKQANKQKKPTPWLLAFKVVAQMLEFYTIEDPRFVLPPPPILPCCPSFFFLPSVHCTNPSSTQRHKTSQKILPMWPD